MIDNFFIFQKNISERKIASGCRKWSFSGNRGQIWLNSYSQISRAPTFARVPHKVFFIYLYIKIVRGVRTWKFTED